MRGQIKFPQISNSTLVEFFDKITHSFEEIVDRVIVATGRNLLHSNNSFFVFTTSDKSIKIPGKHFFNLSKNLT